MSDELARKAAPFMMQAHQKAWTLVMESERLEDAEVLALVSALFHDAIQFAITIDDNRTSLRSSEQAGEVTALRTLVDYVHEAEKQGHSESVRCFFIKVRAAAGLNTQCRSAISNLLSHFSSEEQIKDSPEIMRDLAVLRQMLPD